MRRTPLALVLHAALAPALLAIGARVVFTRNVAPPRELGAESVAVVYAIGDNDHIGDFVEAFIHAVNRAGTLHIANAVGDNNGFDEASLKRLHRDHPADVYLGVNVFTCSSEEKVMEGSEHTLGGDRVKRVHHWVDATCRARVDILSGDDGKRLFSYNVRGEGTSPRSVELTSDERSVAFQQAARYAAIRAAEEITPRVVREAIELDENAPAFDEGFDMIRSERLDEARAIWEAALHNHADSAALHFNLGAVCEAAGDVVAARDYYARAVRLSPSERRYTNELTLFSRRNAKNTPKTH
jgi:tetratricopeptide (TPR) repeat protein